MQRSNRIEMRLRMATRVVLFALMCLACNPLLAVQPDEVLPNPALESRARALSRELRCMVCQNQSIDDSDAPLARDLRLLVRERLSAGDQDGQVLDFLVARYGEFVLLKPRLEWQTALLWITPVVALGCGLIVGFVSWRQRKQSGSLGQGPIALTQAEQARLTALTAPASDRSETGV